jgi:rod shape determining protein RodA
MYGVANRGNGTAHKYFASAPYKIAAKSGTAQVFGLKANETYNAHRIAERLRDHKLMTAFAPYNNPQVAVAMILENGGAGPAVGTIMRQILDHIMLGDNNTNCRRKPGGDGRGGSIMTDNPNKKSLWDKIHLDPTMLLILLALLTYSALVIWSASGQDIGMMERKIGQIAMGVVIMIVMAQIPPRVYEGWAPYLYIFCIILLVAVDAFGAISKGAQRWLDLGIVRFQPSEIAKIAVPLMVARFINRDVCPPSLKNTAIALVLIFLPTLLVAAQPDLGTSILIALSGLFVLFLSGLSWRLIGIAVVLVAAFIPILWFFLMHDYQRQRVMMLLDPETDPLGAGYHIIQSKIAIGSGGLRGKGWLHGTQSQLEFLPERHTDFIFAVLAEELGLIGVLILLALYILLIMRGLWIAARRKPPLAGSWPVV